MTTPLFEPATTTAALIRRGEIRATELVRAQLERIQRANTAVNALVEVHPEQALMAARVADGAVRRGQLTSELHGIPITIKEAFQVRGFRSTWGNPDWAQALADRDATVVSRLRDAGAIVLGTSNVAEMLGDFGQTSNPVYGRTSNPWDPSAGVGGSTGGGAAAVAAGLSFLDYGSDLAGSVRIPAAFCGVYGLKPSVGIVPGVGLQPPGPPAPPSERAYQAGFGPLARSAADIRAALRCTAGPMLPTAAAWHWSLPAPRHQRLQDYRVRYVLDHPAAPVSDEVGAALSEALDTLARAGVTLVEGWPEGIDAAADAESFGVHLRLYFAYLDGVTDLTLPDAIDHEHRRMSARQAWQDCLTSDADVLVCPTASTTAFAHDDRPFSERTITTSRGPMAYASLPFWISHASLTGLPALSAPIGLSRSGLPASMQIIGPLYEDDTAITFAELAAHVIGGYQRPPADDTHPG